MAAVEAGASVWVHVYNGMRGFTHREPGMVGAAFDSPETIGELIADGHHAVPAACKVLIKQKTPQGVALITDCMSAGGRPDGDIYWVNFLSSSKMVLPASKKVVT